MQTNEAFLKMYIDSGLKQTDIAYMLDTSKQLVNKWVSGKQNIPFNRLEQAAKELGYKVIIKLEKE